MVQNINKSVLATALASVMGVSVAHAYTINLSYSGWFTMLNAGGTTALNNNDATGAPWYGWRTPITGTLTIDTQTGAGTGTMTPFSFFGNGLVTAKTLNLQAIGDGAGGPGTLVLGNLGFDWNGSTGIPVSTVWDASGLYSAIGGGSTTSDVITGGALPATNTFAFSNGKSSYTLPLGPAPFATTTWNTSDAGTIAFGSNPSGTLPLTDDGIGGSPMKTGPFPGFSANFDFTTLTAVNYFPSVPIPSAIWLFGSGLLGLVGIARRRSKSNSA